MSKTIRIDDDVERELERIALQHQMVFCSQNDVLRLLLRLDQSTNLTDDFSSDTGAKIYGKQLAKKWGVKVRHALYRKTGDWYHYLKRFPAAYFDKSGYVVFDTEADFKNCRYLRLGVTVQVPDGIDSIPGYIQVH